MSDLPAHGGDLSDAVARWGQPDLGWLDLSTGLNPWPYPVPDLDPALWHRLPDRALDRALRAMACRRYRTPAPERLLAAAGSGAIIAALPRLVRALSTVAILGPTYGEHGAAWTNGGHNVRAVTSPFELEGADVLVVVNPNNPDGRLFDPGLLADWAARLADRGGLLVVDEAFCDLVPDHSVASRDLPATIVLRSFGKFYGLAGMRLGFAIAAPDVLDRLARLLGPWPVSAPALVIAASALADDLWDADTRLRLDAQGQALDRILSGAGLEIVGGTALFKLVRHPDARALWNALGRKGIIVRAFAHDVRLLRIGLPGTDADLSRLSAALHNG